MRFPTMMLPLLLAAAPALAQAPAPTSPGPSSPAAPATAAPATTAAAANPVVARVEGQELHLADVQEAIADLPPELRNGTPLPALFPLVLDQLIAQKAILNAARAQGLDKDPAVVAAVRRAEDEQLQQALLRREIASSVTEEALRARYATEVAGKPGEEEVHARHILVPTEAAALAALAEVRKPGADFVAVAKRLSTGPGSAEGGDLGFFKKADMVPEFANAAFALQAGQISDKPVQSPFGWHIIKVEARRSAPVPTFEESAETLRQAAFEEAVNAAVARIQASAKIERFNMDGSPRAATPAPSLLDNATPPARRP